MKIIKSSYQIVEQPPSLKGINIQIEKAGRTCYKSEEAIREFYGYSFTEENWEKYGKTGLNNLGERDPKIELLLEDLANNKLIITRGENYCNGMSTPNITFTYPGTSNKFVQKLIRSKHYAMLEHGTVYLKLDNIDLIASKYSRLYENILSTNPYTKTNIVNDNAYITTNYRVLVENKCEELLDKLCNLTEHHEPRITVKFICSRAIAQEFTRHRRFSFAMESQRYCNYSKDKFNKEITFIQPSWVENLIEDNYRPPENSKEMAIYEWQSLLKYSEDYYNSLIKRGWKPEQAREVLPNSCKTELVMTGFKSDWLHLFRQRCSFLADTGKPHPDMSALCDPLYKELFRTIQN